MADTKLLELMPTDDNGNPLDWNMFLLQVAAGKIPGFSFINKFGENPDIDTTTDPEDVWSQGGLYTFSSSADIDTLSSSDAGDDQSVEIHGLDANWEVSVQTVTLNGQTKVTLGAAFLRVFRMINKGTTDIAGTVYCYVNGAATAGVPDTAADIRATMNSDNQTEMAIYTIPSNKTGFMIFMYVHGSRTGNNATIVTLRTKENGGVMRVRHRLSLVGTGSSNEDHELLIPMEIPEMTDVLWRVDEVDANSTGIAAGFSIILVDGAPQAE